MKSLLLTELFKPVFPWLLLTNNWLSLNAPLLMLIFAVSLAFFGIGFSAALLIIDWFFVGLALGHEEIDDRWLPAGEADADDTIEDGVVGKLWAGDVKFNFNDCGRSSTLPLQFDVSKPTIGFVLDKSSLLLPLPRWFLLCLIDCCCLSKYDWIAFFWNAFNVGFGTRCVLLGSKYVQFCLLIGWLVCCCCFCCCFSSSLIRSATDCQLWLLGSLNKRWEGSQY